MRRNWLAAVAALIFTGRAFAQVYLPIPVTGYNQDVIALAGGTAMGVNPIPLVVDRQVW